MVIYHFFFGLIRKIILMSLHLFSFSVDGNRDGSLKRNQSNSMICVSSSNSTSGVGREGDVSVTVGSDQVQSVFCHN